MAEAIEQNPYVLPNRLVAHPKKPKLLIEKSPAHFCSFRRLRVMSGPENLLEKMR
jgi:hypothetical protein